MRDQDGYIVVCSECKSDTLFTHSWMMDQGVLPACRMCGGVLIITHQDNRTNSLNHRDIERGIGRGTNAQTS